MMSLRFEVKLGDTIEKAAQDVVHIANKTDSEVSFEFNGVDLTIKPGEDEQSVVNRYRDER